MKEIKAFRTIRERSLDAQLAPPDTLRLLNKDITRRDSIPKGLAYGGKYTDNVSLTYYTNASAGTVSTSVNLNLTTSPLVLVWYLGTIDSVGAVVNTAGGLMNSNQASTIFSGATAKVLWDKNEITFTIVSTNVASANTKTAYFGYVVYYDKTDDRLSAVNL